jgi:hypothetical protein
MGVCKRTIGTEYAENIRLFIVAYSLIKVVTKGGE